MKAGEILEDALSKTRGIVSVSKTWDMDKYVYELVVNEAEALKYGLTREDIKKQIQMALTRSSSGNFSKK